MILDNFKLTGQVALVTGCNTGLGQGMAIALAQAGADIVGVNVTDPTETASAVTDLGRKFLDLRANLSDTACLDGVVQQALGLTGAINILVNNAGIIRRNDAIDFTEKDWDDVVDLNLKTVFFLSQAVARQFMKQGAGGGGGTGTFLHRVQERCDGHYPRVGKRMGGARDQCQRHCSRIHVHR
jgi:2-deoxy-D-gluconate 3-dehydrogenase